VAVLTGTTSSVAFEGFGVWAMIDELDGLVEVVCKT
jgi:hypothetical protein